jgi:hypothetical protein
MAAVPGVDTSVDAARTSAYATEREQHFSSLGLFFVASTFDHGEAGVFGERGVGQGTFAEQEDRAAVVADDAAVFTGVAEIFHVSR